MEVISMDSLLAGPLKASLEAIIGPAAPEKHGHTPLKIIYVVVFHPLDSLICIS